MDLVIRGAYYYDEERDIVLTPHFTGYFNMVDCTIYMTMEELKEEYSESYINGVIDNPVKYNGVEYYDAEYRPLSVNDWEILSDLSKLTHEEEDYDWEV